MIISKVKAVLGVLLITIGMLYEIVVYFELVGNDKSSLTSLTDYGEISTTSFEEDFQSSNSSGSSLLLATHNYHHLLYGMSLIAGAMLLCSVKETD